MSLLLNFIDQHKRQLVQIYTKERQSTGEEGLLWILETPDKRANVSYVPFDDIPEGIVDEVNKLKAQNGSDSIIYFYVCDPLLAQIIQIDLRDFNPDTAKMNYVPNVTVIDDNQSNQDNNNNTDTEQVSVKEICMETNKSEVTQKTTTEESTTPSLPA